MRFLSLAMPIGMLFLLSGCLPLGDRSAPFHRFVNDLFRLHMDGPDVVSRGWDFEFGNLPPLDKNERRAVRLREGYVDTGQALSCEDVVVLGFDEWEIGALKAAEARANATDNTVTSEMQWPNFWVWYSPVLPLHRQHRSILGNFLSASFDIAILGDETVVFEVIDPASNSITPSALEGVLAFKSGSYQRLYENRLASKSFTISNLQRCGNMSLFSLDIE